MFNIIIKSIEIHASLRIYLLVSSATDST